MLSHLTYTECSTRQLQRDRVRDGADAAHVALHDHLLPAQLALRRRQLDLLPHPQRGHPGQDGAPSHSLPCSGEFGWFGMTVVIGHCHNFARLLSPKQCRNIQNGL